MNLDEGKRLLAAGTERPWGPPGFCQSEREWYIENEEGGSVLATIYSCGTPGESARCNAALIVYAVNNLAALIERCEQAEAEAASTERARQEAVRQRDDALAELGRRCAAEPHKFGTGCKHCDHATLEKHGEDL